MHYMHFSKNLYVIPDTNQVCQVCKVYKVLYSNVNDIIFSN